jgi:hypothetical protein
MAPSSLSTNCGCAFRGGPAGYRQRRTAVKARRGHHTSRADLALAWRVSKYRDAHAFHHASGSHSMARVDRRHHIMAQYGDSVVYALNVDSCPLTTGTHMRSRRLGVDSRRACPCGLLLPLETGSTPRQRWPTGWSMWALRVTSCMRSRQMGVDSRRAHPCGPPLPETGSTPRQQWPTG